MADYIDLGIGWLSWVGLTYLLMHGSPDSSSAMSENGISTRLFSAAVVFNEFCLFTRHFNIHLYADQQYIVLRV